MSDHTVHVAGDTAVVVETDTVRSTTNGQPSTTVSRMAAMIFCVGHLGPGLRRVPVDENRRRYFLSTNALWNRNSVAGLRIAASLATRRGRTNSVIGPNTNRSIVVRGGAHRLERRLMRSCCLSSRDSAMTERTTPGRASFVRVTRNCTARRSKSRIVEAGYPEYHAAQDCS